MLQYTVMLSVLIKFEHAEVVALGSTIDDTRGLYVGCFSRALSSQHPTRHSNGEIVSVRIDKLTCSGLSDTAFFDRDEALDFLCDLGLTNAN